MIRVLPSAALYLVACATAASSPFVWAGLSILLMLSWAVL